MARSKTLIKKGKKEYKIIKKRSNRYMVIGKGGKTINGIKKVEILLKEGLIKTKLAKPKLVNDNTSEEKAVGKSKSIENT